MTAEALESWRLEPRRAVSKVSLYLAAASALVCGYRFYRLRGHPEFSDEADNVVLGWLLARGETLYGTVFSHHMPFAYQLGQLVAWLSPADRLGHFRLVPWLGYLALGAALSTRWSPLDPSRRAVVAPAMFLLSAALALPAFLGHTFTADAVWGTLFAALVVRVLLPFVLQARLSRSTAALGGVLLALAPAASLIAAYPVALVSATLGLCALLSAPHRGLLARYGGVLLVALCATGGAELLWLTLFGDLRGFFDQALLFNFNVYSHYNPTQSTLAELAFSPLISFAAEVATTARHPRSALDPGHLLSILAVLSIASVARLSWRAARVGQSSWGRSLLLRLVFPGAFTVTLVFLRMRDGGFRALPLYILVLALTACAADELWVAGRRALGTAGCLALLGVLFIVVRRDPAFFLTPDSPGRADEPVAAAAEFVRAHSGPDERVASLNLSPLFYLLAQRRPALDDLFYLPWQSSWERDYLRDPDTCRQLEMKRPRFIFLKPYKIWNIWEWEDYGACLDGIVRAGYFQVEPQRLGGFLWQRRDHPEIPTVSKALPDGVAVSIDSLDGPPYEVRGTKVYVARSVDGILRVRGRAVGFLEGAGDRRVFLVLSSAKRQLVIPASRIPRDDLTGPPTGAPSRWVGWEAIVRRIDLSRGSYKAEVRLVDPAAACRHEVADPRTFEVF